MSETRSAPQPFTVDVTLDIFNKWRETLPIGSFTHNDDLRFINVIETWRESAPEAVRPDLQALIEETEKWEHVSAVGLGATSRDVAFQDAINAIRQLRAALSLPSKAKP